MILGLSFSTFTWVHVIISLIMLVAGFIVTQGLLQSRVDPAWTAAFIISGFATTRRPSPRVPTSSWPITRPGLRRALCPRNPEISEPQTPAISMAISTSPLTEDGRGRSSIAT